MKRTLIHHGGESVWSAKPSHSGVSFYYYFLFLFLFADLLSQSTTKSLGNQTVPREIILNYICVVISAVQMIRIRKRYGEKNRGERLH